MSNESQNENAVLSNETSQSSASKSSVPAKIVNGWTSLSKKGKVAVGIGFATTVSLGLFALMNGNGEYVSLYSNLDYEQAGAVKKALEESGVTDYKIGDNGTSILVKKEDVDSLRMDLAVSGAAPVSGTGYELFDSASFGMTEQERQVLYQRALEGEIRRSILTLSAVQEARVHLTMSSDSVFMRDPQPSSASIILQLKSPLEADKVEGIVALVSGAVQNLSSENIKIIDTEGNLLNKQSGNQDSYSTSFDNKVAQEANYESYLEDKLQEQLGKVFGYDKIAASVRVTISQTSEEQRREEYTEGAIVSEQNSFNRVEGDNATDESGGPLDNNTQNIIDGTPEDALKDDNVIEYDKTTNYQPTVTETHTVKPPGEIENVAVSVIYSGEINEVLQEQIANHAASIVGIRAERGDVITVAGIPFDLPQIDDGIDLEQQTSKQRISLYGLLAAVVVGGTIAFMLKRKKDKVREEEEEALLEEYLLENEVNADELEQEMLRVMEEGTYLEKLNNLEVANVDVVDLLDEYFEQNLEEGISILQRWVREDNRLIIRSVDNAKFDGVERTARLLIILGKDRTTKILKEFNPEETVKICHIISGITAIPHTQIMLLAEQFLSEVDERHHSAYGGYMFAHDILIDTIGVEPTDNVLPKPINKTSDKGAFEVIENMDSQQVYNVLADEHPQIIAMVLCYLPPEKAAHVVSQFSPEMQLKLTQRIGMMNDTPAQIVETVGRVIETRLQNLVSGQMSQVGGLSTIVEILNNVDRSTQKQIINSLSEENPRLASDVLDNLFTFEDIVKLDAMTVQRILRDVDQSVLVLSLKASTEEIKEHILGNVSQRQRERILEDLQYLGAVKVSDVEAAQRKIVDVIRSLEEQGEIQIAQGGDSDVIV